MTEINHRRRGLLIATAAGGAAVAAGGVGVLVTNARGQSDYEEAVSR